MHRATRVTTYAVMGAAVAVLAGACTKGEHAKGGAASGAAGGAHKLTIALLPKKKGIDYFTSVSKGAMAAAAQDSVTLIYDGPDDGSPEKAASMIEKWALKGVDVIAVSPNDPSVLAPAMKAARARGSHVITWDADGQPDTREWFVNQATAEQIGGGLVDAMAADLKAVYGAPEGDVAIVTATLTAANQNEWIKYMKARLASQYPKMHLVAVKPSNEDQRVAFQVTRDLMTAYPNLRGVFGISSVSFPGAAEAVKQAGRSGKTLVTGLATPNGMRAYVMDGTVRSVVLWNTEDLGYLTVKAAEAVANGTLKAGATTFDAGKLGQKTVAGDNVLLGGILIFNKDNIGQYNF